MEDLISKQKAIEIASKECWELRGVFERIEEALSKAPSERKIGKWVRPFIYYDGFYECDQCGNKETKTSNFCPHCGADMRGK